MGYYRLKTRAFLCWKVCLNCNRGVEEKEACSSTATVKARSNQQVGKLRGRTVLDSTAAR